MVARRNAVGITSFSVGYARTRTHRNVLPAASIYLAFDPCTDGRSTTAVAMCTQQIAAAALLVPCAGFRCGLVVMLPSLPVNVRGLLSNNLLRKLPKDCREALRYFKGLGVGSHGSLWLSRAAAELDAHFLPCRSFDRFVTVSVFFFLETKFLRILKKISKYSNSQGASR